jgi:hypothetical protein
VTDTADINGSHGSEEDVNDRNQTDTSQHGRRSNGLIVVFNGLLASFTFLLLLFTVFSFYVKESPEIVVSPVGVENIDVGQKPTISVRLSLDE